MKDKKAIANEVIRYVTGRANPRLAVKEALGNMSFEVGKIIVISIGKAAVSMALGAEDAMHGNIRSGLVVTKYCHGENCPKNFELIEAGHPVPDENSVLGGKRAAELVQNLTADDTVIFLVSGGGSALFELPVIPLDEYKKLTDSLLKSGCDITELNTVRKHLSHVKGGGFASLCKPAKVRALLLSDVIGDDISVIASGPCAPDKTTKEDAEAVLKKYKIGIPSELTETPKDVPNAENIIIGGLSSLCTDAETAFKKLGFNTKILDTALTGEASEQAEKLARLALETPPDTALIMGGETTVTIHGGGLGGRNQEFALSASRFIRGRDDILIFAYGTDGTDGPTDAAGGMVCGDTYDKIAKSGKTTEEFLADNDSYHALPLADALIKTGPTGTNVCDLYCAIIL